MSSIAIWGALIVFLAGLLLGSGAWPMKLMATYRFEHWWFVSMVTGLLIIPWTITTIFCPDFLTALASISLRTLLVANLCAFGWGIANILCGLCFVRIGMALTTAILTGIGASLGVVLPMIIKGSGSFQNAPNLNSRTGLTVLVGLAVMVLGVISAARAGFGRNQSPDARQQHPNHFFGGLLMAIAAGILSCGISLSFVYGQAEIVEAMKRQGAGETPAQFAVWAVGLFGGALVNAAYPLWIMNQRKSWKVLTESFREFLLAVVIGINMTAGIVIMGRGMLMLGALGGAVGFGIQQASWMLGGQAVGFLSGEWRGVTGAPRTQMYLAIALLVIACLVLVCANQFG